MMISRIASFMTSDDDDDCLIIVRLIGATFYLQYLPSDLASAPSLLQQYLVHLRELRDDGDNHTSTLNRLMLPFNALMDELVPASKQGPFSLHDYLYPPSFQLTATAAEEQILPVREKENSPFGPPGIAMESLEHLALDTWVPRWFSSHEIEIPGDAEGHPLLQTPSRVIAKKSQTECFFKSLGPGYTGNIHELLSLRAINDAINSGLLPMDIRVCSLYGVIVDTIGPHKRLVGILLNYIKAKRHGILGTLQYIAYEEHSRKYFDRWANDLNDILGGLHKAGCIWGDAKPENVLVDNNNNVWLIDFGGGYTPGWVDKGQQCTKKGDSEAMERILLWLKQLRIQ